MPRKNKKVDTAYFVIGEHFKCPRCGVSRLEEIMTNVTVRSTVDEIGPFGDCHYGHDSHEDGEVEGYQCVDCGWRVPNVRNAEELYNWLKDPNRDMSDVGDECKDEWMQSDGYNIDYVVTPLSGEE